MAVAFANNWDIILSKLESLFRDEFKGALKVYSGLQNEMEGNQYLRLSPISSSLVDYSTNLETREFVIGMALYFNEPNIKKAGIDNVMRLVSRIETIIANNNSITLPDSSVVYDCKIESSEIEASDSEYLVEFNFRCTHANSISYPTIAITAAEVVDGASSTDSTLSLTFKTSHVTTNFAVGDVSVSNGSLSNFAGSGTIYTATFTPSSGGATTIQVVASKFTDYSGNNNVASDVFNWTYLEKFVSTWTLSVADTVSLPLVNGGTYNFDVDWGDGTTSTITAYDQAEVTHSYGSGGVKTISIGGTNSTITGWKFNNTGDKTLITGISNWGTLNISTNGAFYGCENLNVTANNAPTISTTTLEFCFRGCTPLTSIGGNWDISSVENIKYMFYSCTNFNQDISGLDTSSVTNMQATFQNATSFNQNISGWDTSSLTGLAATFQNATSFNQNLNTWDWSNVVDAWGCFRDTTAFTNGGVNPNWVLTENEWYNEMFYNSGFGRDLSGCTGIGNKTGGTVSYKSMFQENSDFDHSIAHFVVTKVKTGTFSMQSMFGGSGSGLSTANYNATLIAWAAVDASDSVIFGGGNSEPTGDGDTARQSLIDDDSWSITDGD